MFVWVGFCAVEFFFPSEGYLSKEHRNKFFEKHLSFAVSGL